jgi:hypothetical protein
LLTFAFGKTLSAAELCAFRRASRVEGTMEGCMKQIIALAALALTAGCTAASAEDEAIARADGETKLAAELRDYRQSGEPMSCVPLRNLGNNRSAGEGVVIFGGNTSRLYVNRPSGGCPLLRIGTALSVRTSGTQICRGDIVSVFDPQTGVNFGSCGLGDFTPYERRRDG